ncbi:MAG: hypothetical protein Q9160_001155 [Pyrenula sp. 1 TL-2023]
MPNKYSHGNVLSHLSEIGVINLPSGIAAQYPKRDGPKDTVSLGMPESRGRPRTPGRDASTTSSKSRPHSLHQNMKIQQDMDAELLDSYHRAAAIYSRAGRVSYSPDKKEETPKSSTDEKTPELSSGDSSFDSSQSSRELRNSAPANRSPVEDVPASQRIAAKMDRLRKVVDEPRRKPMRIPDAEVSRVVRRTALPRRPSDPPNVQRDSGLEVVEDTRLSSKNADGKPITLQEAEEVDELDEKDIRPDFVPQRQASPPPAAGYEDTKYIEARAADNHHETEVPPENVIVGQGHLPETGIVKAKEDSEVPLAEPRIIPAERQSRGTSMPAADGNAISPNVARHKRDSKYRASSAPGMGDDAVPPDVGRHRSSTHKSSQSDARSSRKQEIKDAERRLAELKALDRDEGRGGIFKKIRAPNLKKFGCM